MHAPDLPEHLQPVSLGADDAADGESWEQVAIVDTALPGIDARALGFVECRFEAVDLSEGRLANLFLSDCELLRPNLANLAVRNGSMRRVVVDGGRLTGLSWTVGEIRDTAFRNCRSDLASFHGTRFDQVLFDDCNLREVDFRQGRFESVVFSACDLTGADLGNARFESCEMRRCTLDGLRGVDRLRGVAMPWTDIVAAAGVFAGQLGVRVLDD